MSDRIEKLEKRLQEMRSQFDEVQSQLKAFAENAWDNAEDALEDGGRQVRKLVKRGKKQARHAWEETKDTASSWAENVNDCVRNHPWSAAAVIGGIALAAAIIYRTAENDSERRFLSRWR